MLRPRLAALLVLAAVTAAGCGDDTDAAQSDAGSATTITTTTEPTTTTTIPTTTTTLPPPTIVVAGDSIVYDVSPALEAALDPAVADVIPLIVPAIAADTSREVLLQRVDESQPELVVVAVGVWERGHRTSNGALLGDPGFAEAYSAEVLDVVRQRVEAVGGDLLLLGPPTVWEDSTNVQFGELEMIWAGYATHHPSVDFVDVDAWVSEGGGFVEFDEGDGPRTRLRRTDRVHLCVEGATRVARGLISEFEARLGIDAGATATGWEQGEWTERFPADECPPD